MSQKPGWTREHVGEPAKTSATRCPSCYARVPINPDDDHAAAIYSHELSGQCKARVETKVRKPPKSRKPLDAEVVG